jgi:hypothetical protein
VSDTKTLIIGNEHFNDFENVCRHYDRVSDERRDIIFGHCIVEVPVGLAAWPLLISGVEESAGEQRWMVDEGDVSLFDPDDFPSVGWLNNWIVVRAYSASEALQMSDFYSCDTQDISDYLVQMDEYGYEIDD